VVDSLRSLASPVAYLVVATLAALEVSAFVGLCVPGELALLTGATSHIKACGLGLTWGVHWPTDVLALRPFCDTRG